MTLRLRKDDVIGAALLAALLIFVLAPLLTVIVWNFGIVSNKQFLSPQSF